MSNVKPVLLPVRPHRACDWNEKAIQKVIDEHGHILAGVKHDGIRGCVYLGDRLRLVSRTGRAVPNVAPEVLEYVVAGNGLDIERMAATNRVLDCEVYIAGLPFEESTGRLMATREPLTAQERDRLRFVVFDSPTLAEYRGQAEPVYVNLSGRIQVARGIIQQGRHFHFENPIPLGSIQAIARHYERVRRIGMEGLILKDPRLPYRNGKVSGWWKVKPGCGADFAPGWEGDGKVVEYILGSDDRGNAGMVVGYEVEMEAGFRVRATGLTQEHIEWATHDALATRSAVGRIVEVHAMERSKNTLRHPKFARWRDDPNHPGEKV